MKRMKKIGLSSLIAIALLLIVISACKKEEEKTFIASGHPAWAPIMYQENNFIVGAGPEIVTMAFKELGIKIISSYEGNWDLVQEKAEKGEVDIIVAAYKTAEREAYMDYSKAYTIDPISIFVNKNGVFSFNEWSDLIGKNGVVTKGDSYGQEFDNFIKDSLNVTIVETPKEAFDMLINGQSDYFVYALYSGENMIEDEDLKDQIEILQNHVTSEDFYMTISKKSPLIQYLPQINQLLEKYQADGTIEKIIKKY